MLSSPNLTRFPPHVRNFYGTARENGRERFAQLLLSFAACVPLFVLIL
jgi:hypothetical protein